MGDQFWKKTSQAYQYSWRHRRSTAVATTLLTLALSAVFINAAFFYSLFDERPRRFDVSFLENLSCCHRYHR